MRQGLRRILNNFGNAAETTTIWGLLGGLIALNFYVGLQREKELKEYDRKQEESGYKKVLIGTTIATDVGMAPECVPVATGYPCVVWRNRPVYRWEKEDPKTGNIIVKKDQPPVSRIK